MAESRAESMQKYLHRAFVNNTYSDKSTHSILGKAVETSYQHLYELQKSLVGYEEHYLKITRSVENLRDPNKLYFNKNFKPCINVNRNEIDICNTRDFKKSEYFNKEITYEDVISHPEIFNRIPIITIDNHVIWDFHLHFTDKYATIILPVSAKTIFEYKRHVARNTADHDKRIYNEHDMHIQLIDNIFCYQMTAASQSIKTSQNVITVNVRQMISLSLPPKLKRIFDTTQDMETAITTVMVKFNELIDLIETDGMEASWNKYKKIDGVIGKDDYYSSLKYYSNNIMLSYAQFKNTVSFITFNREKHKGILFGSIHVTDTIGTNLIEFKNVDENHRDSYYCILTGNMDINGTYINLNEFTSSFDYITISFVFIPDMRKHTVSESYKHYTNYEGQLEMPLMVPMKDDKSFKSFSMPIPTENCMIFKNNATTGVRELIPYTRLKLYYPNIYQITDYDVYMSTLETPGSVSKTVVSDDTEVIDPETEIRLCDVIQQLPFVEVGATIYVRIDDDRAENDTYEFYYAYKEGEDLQYTPVTDFYMEFINFTKYGNFDAPFETKVNALYRATSSDECRDEFVNTILTYEAYIHKYGDIDFIHRFKKNALFTTEKFESRKYEDDVLKKWVKNEPYVLRDYVIEQHKKNSSYYLYTATIDLESRMHTSTSTFITTKVLNAGGDGTNPVVATGSWYVFSMVNTEPEGMLNQIRVYVDNLAVTDNIFHVRDGYMDYICIPTEYVTDKSFIEVELMAEFYFESSLTFTSVDDEYRFSITSPNEHVQPAISDFVLYEDNSSKRLPSRYDPDFVRITTETEYGEFLSSHGSDLHPLNFLTMTTFKITPTDEDILDIPLKIRFSKMCEGNRYIVPTDGEVYLEFVDNRFAYSKEFLRVYINGHLIARENYLFYPMYHHPRIRFIEESIITYSIAESTDEGALLVVADDADPFDDETQIKISDVTGIEVNVGDYVIGKETGFQIKKGDVIYIEVTPYRYKQIYYKRDIHPSDTEDINEMYDIIDLKTIIDKPFDIRYYDIYINGKKLSINNCIPLDPWSVKLVNLKSKYNLIIFEKERDFEFYGIDFTKDHPYPTIEDFMLNHKENTNIIEGFFYDYVRRRIPTFVDETTGEVVPVEVEENTNTEHEEYYPDPEHQYIYFIFESFYFDELIGKGFMNPDIMQLSYMVMRDWFNEVYSVYKTSAVESTHEDEPKALIRRGDYVPVITIDPDIDFTIRDPEEGEEFVPTVVYSVGHDDDVSQTILDEEVVMKTEKTIDKYVPMALINDIDWEESDE